MRFISLLLLAFVIVGPVPANDDGNRSMDECRMAPQELQIAQRLLDHPGQQRRYLVCDPRLQEFAEARARDMAERDYFGHVTPDREGPNSLLRKTGYSLPKYYVGGIANSVESILAGEEDAGQAWKLLLDSPTHRKHLLGEETMYLKQQRFGVGYFHKPASKYAHYWVIVVAEHGASKRAMTCTPPPSICIVH